MSLPALIAIGLGFALTAYAILAGADFGAGILDLTATHSPEQRTALAHTIGPLWEANHVWLIFSITLLFSAFPTAFAALGTVVLAPLTLALMAIVIRAVTFALRSAPAPQPPAFWARRRRSGTSFQLHPGSRHRLVAPLDRPVRRNRRTPRRRAVRT